MGIQALGGPFCLPGALVLSIPVGPVIQSPPAGVVSAALGVVVPAIGTSIKIRAALQAVVVRRSRSITVLVKTVDPAGTTEIVGMRMMVVVVVGRIAKRVRLRIADPEVMAVVKRVAVSVIRRVVVTVGAVAMAESA
jgi:hypothetical protein